jgi:hypothetical protein
MPEHYLSLSGASVLRTHDLQLVDHDIHDLIRHQAMGVVHGRAGVGKSFAVQAALERLQRHPFGPSGRAPARVVTAIFPHAPTTLRVVLDLAHVLLAEPPQRATRFRMQDFIIDELSRQPHLLVIDEAQRLTRNAMEVLRYCFDDPRTQLALLLVGGDGCWEVIAREPMLMSRVFRRRQFRPLPGAQVPSILRTYHPFYRDADDELLQRVDAEYAHGIWRAWAAFTLTATDLAAQASRTQLDAEIVANTYVSLGAAAVRP